jgi:hypothetical protein
MSRVEMQKKVCKNFFFADCGPVRRASTSLPGPRRWRQAQARARARRPAYSPTPLDVRASIISAGLPVSIFDISAHLLPNFA